MSVRTVKIIETLFVEEDGKNRLFDQLAIFFVMGVAFVFCFRSGQKSFFALDQSIVFDGAHRILQGQVPYRDFIAPFGPVSLWIQALFFKLFGTSYFSYLLHACVLNALATWLVVAMIRSCFPHYRLVALSGGLITAFWFYAPSGTPYMEQTAFSFSLLGLFFAIRASLTDDIRRARGATLGFLAGFFAIVSVLSKQNAGVLFLPLYFLLFALHLRDPRRTIRLSGHFLLGAGTCALLFAMWLYGRSDVQAFFQYTIEVPRALASRRMSFGEAYAHHLGILSVFLSGPTILRYAQLQPTVVRIVHVLALSTGLLCFLVHLSSSGSRTNSRRAAPAYVLLVFIPLFHTIFVHSAWNESENGLPFIGLVFGMLVGVVLDLRRRIAIGAYDENGLLKPLKLRWLPALAGLLSLALCSLLIWVGFHASLGRMVHRRPHNGRYSSVQGVRNLRYLRLPDTNSASRSHGSQGGWSECADPVSATELAELYRYLERSADKFFVFPDYTILYGVLDRPSPQPLLWFHNGLTYLETDNSILDERIVRSLEENQVTMLVLEQVTCFSTSETLKHFPQLASYMEQHFVDETTIGNFLIRRKSK